MALRVFVRRDRCLGCRSCEIACALWRDSAARRLPAAVLELPAPRSRVRLLVGPGGLPFPNQCRQCHPAPCAQACPTGALVQRMLDDGPRACAAGEEAALPGAHVPGEADGEIGFRHELCIGCFGCLFACPFGALLPDARGRIPLRCDVCAEMEYAACVDSCPAGALVLCDPAEWDPAEGWDPFAPGQGGLPGAGGRAGIPASGGAGPLGGGGLGDR